MDCGMKMCKYLLFLFNLIFFICGLALCIIGGVGVAKAKGLLPHDGEGARALDTMVPVCVVIIIVGVVIFVVAFLGCCGAVKENQCMLKTFAVLIAVVLLAQIALGIAAFVKKDEVMTKVDKEVKGFFNVYDKTSAEPYIEYLTKAVDKMQEDFKCCGWIGPEDWAAATPSKDKDDVCDAAVTVGCKKAMNVQEMLIAVGGAAIGLAFVELLGIIMACCLARSIKEDFNVA